MLLRKITALGLSLLGLFDSLYLFYSYTSAGRPMVCIGTGCDAVRASAYSKLWGVPMPVFGVLGYALLAMVTIGECLFSARLARWARYAFLGGTGFGFLFSLYLEYVQTFAIHAYCAWCVTSGVVMTALFAIAIVNVIRSGPEPEPATQLVWARGLFAVCVAGLVAGVPAFYLLARHSQLAPAAPQAAAADLAQRLVRPGSHEAGNPQAPLTVVEFGDFECSVCGQGEAAARDIRVRYSRQVRFVFRQFPLPRIHPFAEKAAEASECAGDQGRFWEMVEKIYSRQDDLSVEGLERDAAELGLDQPRFKSCLASGATAGRVRQDMEDGRALGVRATPTFFIGPQRVEGVLTAAQFSQLIEGQLASLGAAGEGERRETPAAAARTEAAPRQAVQKPVPAAQPAAGAQTATANPAQDSSAPLGLGLGGFGGATSGLPGSLQPSGRACSETDAAKTQPELIHTAELRQLLTSGAKVLFVDVRPASDYAAGRIPGAVSLPADDIGRRWESLPKDRTIVLYESGQSSGDVCAAGRTVGRSLLEHGFPFSRVKVYQDGLAGWQRAGMDGQQ